MADGYAIKRNNVDNINLRVLNKLRELAREPAIQEEGFKDSELAEVLIGENNQISDPALDAFVNKLKQAYEEHEKLEESDVHQKLQTRLSEMLDSGV